MTPVRLETAAPRSQVKHSTTEPLPSLCTTDFLCNYFLLQLYNQAMDLCMQMYGEYHILTSRLYINIGIVYEDTNNYKKAYEYFKKWAIVSEEILGPEHPKTQRAKGVLRESRYQSIARELGEWSDNVDNNQDDDDDDDDDEVENPDLEHNYDDQFGQNNNQGLAMDNSFIQETNVIEVAPDVDEENSGDVLMNGFYEEEANTGSDRENSDNENFYDDHFEDYDEQYTLYSDHGPVIDEFNIHLDHDDDDDDDEIIQLAARDLGNQERQRMMEQHDNRYASDSHESDDSDSGQRYSHS